MRLVIATIALGSALLLPAAAFAQISGGGNEAVTNESLPFTGGGDVAFALASAAGATGYIVRRFAQKR